MVGPMEERGRTAGALLALLLLVACSPQAQEGVFPNGPEPDVEVPELTDLALKASELPEGTSRLRFAVTPAATGRTEGAYQPIADYLSSVLAFPVELVSIDSYEHIIASVVSGEADLAILPPLSYVLATQQDSSVQLLVQQMALGAKAYSSFIVVSHTDPARSLHDLKGRRISFVDERSASGFLFPYYAFLEHGVDPEKDFSEIRFTGSHTSSIYDIVEKRADAAATASGMLDSTARVARENGDPEPEVRILYKAGRIPYDAVVANDRLSEEATRKIQGAFVSLNTRTSVGRAALGPTARITGWLPADDSLYNEIRDVLARVQEHRRANPGGATHRAVRD